MPDPASDWNGNGVADQGDEYHFLFLTKGGGSANKTFLFQETKALLNEKTLLPWLFEKMKTLGTAACPPYHLAVVIGGTSAEMAVETVFNSMKKALAQGERIELRGFGIFNVRPRKTGIGRNPRTGAEVAIPPGKAVRFKPGKELQSLQ